MIADTRWRFLLCIAVLSLHAAARVIEDEDVDGFGRLDREDPYEEEPFEEDRYEEPMMGDAPAASSASEVVAAEQRDIGECASAADCNPGECCKIGMERYSIPTCEKVGSEGDFCRVNQEPVNTTLYYPNGLSKDLINGYILFCPCAEGLTCLRAICRPSRELYLTDKRHENTL